jgi:hypothetical protein
LPGVVVSVMIGVQLVGQFSPRQLNIAIGLIAVLFVVFQFVKERIFRAEGVPPEFVWQAEAESTFNPAARSPVGAVGLFQFMPATAQQFGLRLSPQDERLDAIKNARAAAKYLRMLHARFGNWPLAFAAYNCGEGRVSKTLRSTGGKTFDDIHDKLPAETRMYVPKSAALVQLRESDVISSKIAKEVFPAMFSSGKPAAASPAFTHAAIAWLDA